MADVAGILAREAANLAQEIRKADVRHDPAAERAALHARDAAGALEILCQGSACPMETYRQTLSALQGAAVALAVAKQAVFDQRAAPLLDDP